MTRIAGVPAKNAGPMVRLIYRLSRRKLGRDADPVAVYAHAPRLLLGYGIFEQATGAQHEVAERLKALAELKAAALVSCEFCCDIGSSLAREAGIGEEQLLALSGYRDSDRFSDLEKLVLDYACAMSRTPAAVGAELFAALREHFSERQLVELTNVIALENMRARFNSALDMTPAGFSDGMVCARPESISNAASVELTQVAASGHSDPAGPDAAGQGADSTGHGADMAHDDADLAGHGAGAQSVSAA